MTVKNTGIKLGFVVAEFNRDITYMMEIEAEEHAKFLGAEVTERLYVQIGRAHV